MLLRKLPFLLAVIFLSSCLPDEGDVSARYNAINQRAHIENVAGSLSTSAQNLTAYLMASQMKRKTPLQNEGKILSDKPTDFTVQNNPKPVPPTGVHVSSCGKYGAIAYFTEKPAGVSSLKQQGNTMAASLVSKFGHDAVGMKDTNGIQLPKKGLTLGCTVGDDIQDGSPIFVAGFLAPDGLDGLPDPKKTTQPTFKRDITLPCPTGTDGVIKREQICQLKFDDNETSRETGTIIIGTASNEIQRLNKSWACTPDLSAPMPPPTSQEISVYCRDPSHDIAKPADDVIELQIPSLKQELEANGSGYYTFFCRKNKDGSNTCDAEPYNPEPKTYLKCDQDMPPPRFTVNPYSPMQLNANGELIGNPTENRDCGKGWYGKLTARYLTRRCQLMKIVDGVSQVVSTPQTIYRVGYAQAQCEADFRTTVACPDPSLLPGSDPSRRIPVTRHVRMLKPVALDWSENKPSPAAWDTSRIATTDSRPEVLLTAGMVAVNKPQAVLPLITRAQLDSHTDTDSWSEALTDAMYNADNDSIERKITSCNNTGDPCGVATASHDIQIWTDPHPLQNMGGDIFNMINLTCSTNQQQCNPILGQTQSMCGGGGQCEQTQANPYIPIIAGNFDELVNQYFDAVDSPLPPNNNILIYSPATSLPLFNDPNAVCEMASSDASRLMIFGFFDETIAFNGVAECPALPGKSYTNIRDMMDDAVEAYKARGGDLLIFANHINLGNEGKPVYHLLNANIFREDGTVTTTLRNWFLNSVVPPSPCTLIPQQ